MQRNAIIAALLGLAGVVAVSANGCKPPVSTYDAGCYPAPISTPSDAGSDAGITCTPWSGGCTGTFAQAIQSAVRSAFAANAMCEQETDCALYAPVGTQFQMLCYEDTFVPAIAAAQRGQLDQQLQSLLCGFCNACFSADAGGGTLQEDVLPYQDAGNCTEVECWSGVCNADTFQQ